MQEQPTVRPKKKPTKKRTFVVIAVLVAVLALAAGGYAAYNYVQNQNETIDRLSDPQQAAKDEATRIKDLVAQLAEVPSDEIPTVATVSDVSKLQGQAFFAKAQNGDKVLIFTKAKKAYLYRPSTNKLIEVAPINIGNKAENTSNQ